MKKIGVAVALTALPGLAMATNGYFAHGYGVKAQGMAGVGIALPQDAMAAATNPAGMAYVGSRMDLGLTWFKPNRTATISNTGGACCNGTFDGNGKDNFFIPEFGYNRVVNPNMSVGLTVYGNGGMNTTYNSGITLFGSAGKAGVDLSQLFIAPTVAYKLNEQHAIGASLNFAYQRFKADGLQGFDAAGFSVAPGSVTNRGYDSSTGWGVRIGWTGQVTPAVTLGATWQSKTRMGAFDKYKGLFAEGGDFDIPENYGVGISIKATPKMTVAADVQRINYAAVKSIANSLTTLTVGGNKLGSANGPGFGWRDMTIFKLGVAYEVSPALTVRAGYSTGNQPIPGSEAMFNILAPGVVEDHLTLGATWVLDNKAEVSVGYMHAFKKSVKGVGAIPAGGGFPGGDVELRMHQDSIGVAYGWKM